MPRNTFSNSFLRGGAGGLTRLASSLMSGDQAYQQGFDAEQERTTKLAQAIAQARANNAQADKYGADAAKTDAERAVLQGRPGLYEEQAALASGFDVPTVQAFRTQVQTGRSPTVPMGPPTEDGDMGAGSFVLPQAGRTKLAVALQQLLPLLANTGDLKPDDLAKAAETYRGMGLSDAIIAGQADRNKVGGAQAAAAGKPAFQRDTTGSVLDEFTGLLDTSNPLAQATIKQRQQYGDAAVTRANRPSSGLRGVIRDTVEGLMLIDPVTGESMPVTDEGGAQLQGKSTEKPMTEGQAKANLFGTRMQEADKILSDLTGKYSPAMLNAKMTAEGAPMVGGLLGFAANSMSPPELQMAEQAQRDFINAVLRRESGAVISDGEFANAKKQYFPQPGDAMEVIAQKAANRRRATELMLAEVPNQHRAKQAGQPTAPKPAAPAVGQWRVQPGDQKARDTDRMAILLREYQAATNPADREAIGREIQRAGGVPPAGKPAPAASGGFKYLGTE